MSRKAKSKSPRPALAGPSPTGANAPSGGPRTAFNYSWRTGAAVVGLGLTLLVFLAMPFGEERVPFRRAIFGMLALDDLPGRIQATFQVGEFWPAVQERGRLALYAVGFLAVGGTVGLACLSCFSRGSIRRSETFSLALLLGASISSVLMFLAAAAAGSTAPVASTWLTLGIAAGACALWMMRRRVGEASPVESWLALWALLGVPATLLALLYGALPPYDFDVLEYHFQIPKEWSQAGQITRTESNVYGAMPKGAEMFVLWGMSVRGDWWEGALIGKVILALFVPLTSLLAGAIAARLAGGRAGLFAGWTALFVPWHWFVGTSGLVDHVWGAYFLAASWTAFRTWFDDENSQPNVDDAPRAWHLRSRPSLRWAALAGAFIGAACACKYPAVPLVGGPLLVFHVVCLIVLVRNARRATSCATAGLPSSDPGRTLEANDDSSVSTSFEAPHDSSTQAANRTAGQASSGTPVAHERRFFPSPLLPSFATAGAVAALTALLLGGGWYLKNAVLYGNPVFPLATELFGDAGWNPELAANWKRVHAVPGETFLARYSPARFLDMTWKWLMATPWASPLIPLGLVALASAKRPPRVVWIFVGLACGFFVLCWATTHRIDRFLVPTYPLLAVAAGVGFAAGTTSIQRLVRQVAFWLGLAWCVVVILFVHTDERLFLPLARLRVDPRIEGLRPRVAPAVQWLNEHAKEKTTLSIGDAAVFDFENPVRYHTCFDDCPLQVWHDEVAGDPDALRRRLAEENIGHVYVDWVSIERYRSPGNYGFPFPIATRENMARLVEQGVLGPPAISGPPIDDEAGPPQSEIFPVPATPSPAPAD